MDIHPLQRHAVQLHTPFEEGECLYLQLKLVEVEEGICYKQLFRRERISLHHQRIALFHQDIADAKIERKAEVDTPYGDIQSGGFGDYRSCLSLSKLLKSRDIEHDHDADKQHHGCGRYPECHLPTSMSLHLVHRHSVQIAGKYNKKTLY